MTATRVPIRLDRVGVSVTIVPADALRLRRPVRAVDVLREVGGAFLDEANGPGGPTIVRLRGGEEVFTQILVDGVQVNQNGGFFDLLGFSLANLERVEVARGPQSALYGSSAMSGVIQFLSRRGEAGPARVAVGAEGSAAATNGGGYRTSAEVAGGTAALRYAAGLGLSFDRGIYELANDARTRDASVRLDASPTDRVGLTGTLRFVGVDAKLPVRDPGATRAPLDPNARTERDRLISSIGLLFAPAARWQHHVRGTLYREDFVYDDRRDGIDGGQYPFFIFDADFRLDSRLVRTGAEYSGDFRSGGAAGLILSWGARLENESLRDITAGDFGDGRQRLERGSVAAFAEALASPRAWLDVMAGARIEKFDGLDPAVTPRASAVVRLVPDRLALRLAAGLAYKAPNLQEQFLDNPFIVSNPDLSPETSTSVEAGLDWTAPDGSASAGMTVFRQRFDDLIRSVAFDTTGRQQNRNLGASRATGVEARLEVRPSGDWSAGLDLAWLRTRILDASGLPAESFPEGAELPFRPRAVGSVWLEARPAAGLTARVRGRYIGAQTVLTERFSGARVPTDAYLLTGLSFDWDAGAGWTFYARLDNVLDTAYETAFDRPGIPATGAIGLRWQR